MTSAIQDPAGLPAYLPAHLEVVREAAPPAELRLRVAAQDFDLAARSLKDAGARFVTVFLADSPEPALVGAFALQGELIVLRAPSNNGDRLAATAIGDWWPAARWPAQELLERHHPRVPDHPLHHRLTAPDADLLDRRVAGLDVFTMPYGPVRSGIFEAIQFQIETGGEDVPRIQTRPFFKHRGREQRFVGLTPDDGVYVAERVAGIATVAYATAYSQAVERALDTPPPARAERWRAVYAELERMACHLDVIAKEAETTALYVGQARFQILKEQVQRLRARLTGSRFARGVIVPGGMRREGAIPLDELLAAVDHFERDLRRDRRLFVGTASMTDRLIGSGRLERPLVEEYSAVGPLARGSGLSTDARHERPYGDYERLGVRVITRPEGDAMARINVRFGELAESLRLLRQAIDHLRRHDGQLTNPLPASSSGAAFGWAEAPQGELVIWVEIRDGLIHRVHIASPSLRNWALFDHAFPKDVLTDFAFIEHSFGFDPGGSGPLMLEWIARGLHKRRITTRYPRREEPAPAGFRGSIHVLDALDAGSELARLCPTGAIAVDAHRRVSVDRGRCILCGACVQAAPERFAFEHRYETAARTRSALTVPQAAEPAVEPLRATLGEQTRALRRSIHVRHIDCGSDGSEEWEIQALWNPYYDIQRLGFFLTAAPRHADVLLVTGPVTTAMREPLERTWQVMPAPKALVAVGTDACSGGLSSPGELGAGGVDAVLAVDVYVPGSPPPPIAIMHGLLLATGLLTPREVAA